MEAKRRSSRLAHVQVDYNEAQPRKTADDAGKASAEAEDDSSCEEEEPVQPAPPKAKKQKTAGRPAGSATAVAGEAGSDDDEEHGDEPGPSARKRQRVVAPSTADVKDLTLFEVVWKQGSAIPYSSKQWLEHYKAHRAEATAQAMSLLLRAGGCDRDVDTEDVEDGNADDMVNEFADIVKKEGNTDPFHKASKNFSSNYSKMWDRIVHEVYHADLLQDHFIMEKISTFVIAMSVSPVRPFRYAATLTACQLVNSWVNTLLALNEAQNTANQQLESERKKKSSKVVLERINMLTKAVEKKRRAVSEVQALVNNLMDAVFAHRFRDMDMTIRALVIKGISNWIFLHPSMFLADQYLKYVAWGMSDKDDVVRAAAVDGLLKLYGVEDNVVPMREFTKRFTNRFMELPYDVDIQVAVRGARLLDRLVAVKQLDNANVRDLYRLLADSSSDLRHAVSDVVVRLLESATNNDAQGAPAKGKSAGSPLDMNTAQAQLLGLLKIMAQLADTKISSGAAGPSRSSGSSNPSTSAADAEAELEPLDDATVAGVVDALHDRLSILQDWNVLCVALLDDRLAALRGGVGDLHLARVLKAAVRLQAGKVGSKKTKGRGVRATKEAAEAADSGLQTLSLVLMQQLPRLLQKFSTNGLVVSALLDIVTDLQLDVYSLKQQEKDLEELTQQVSDVLLKSSHEAALMSAASTLLYLAGKAPTSLQDATQMVLSEALNTVGSKLAEAHRAAKAVPDEELQDAVEEASQGGQGNSQLFNLHLALLRVNVMQSQGSETLGNNEEVFTTLEQIVEEAGQGRNYGSGVIGATLWSLSMTLMWRLRHIITNPTLLHTDGQASPVVEFIATRNAMLTSLVNVYKAIDDQSVREVVFPVAVDMALVLGARHAWVDTPVDDLQLDVSDDVLRACWEHCIDVLDRKGQSERTVEEGSVDETQTEADLDGPHKSAKVAAVAGVGRLLAFTVLSDSQIKWLAPLFVALMGGHGKAVSEVVRDVCRHLRKNKPSLLPDIFVSAMIASFNAASMTASDSQDAHEAAIQEFSSLCAAIASTYAGHNISKGPLLHISEGGLSFVLEDVPTRLPFLEWGLRHFTPKLQAEAAEQLLEELEEGVADVERSLEDSEWSSYDLYCKALKERANTAKVTTRGVLKQPLKFEPTVQKMSRRISFAGEEEEEEPNAQEPVAPVSPAVVDALLQSDEEHEEERHEIPRDSGDAVEENQHTQEPTEHTGAEIDDEARDKAVGDSGDGMSDEQDTQKPTGHTEVGDEEEEEDQGTPELEHAAPSAKQASTQQTKSSDGEEAEEQVEAEGPAPAPAPPALRPRRGAGKKAAPAQRSSKRGRRMLEKDAGGDAEDEQGKQPEHQTAEAEVATSEEDRRGPNRKRRKASFAIMPGPATAPQEEEEDVEVPEGVDTGSPTQPLTTSTQRTAPSSSTAAAQDENDDMPHSADPTQQLTANTADTEQPPPSSSAAAPSSVDVPPSASHSLEPTQDLNLEASEEPSQEPSGRGRKGKAAAKGPPAVPVSRRVTRGASQEVAGSQPEVAGNVRGGKGRGKKPMGGQQQHVLEDSQAASLDSLGGMMATEEQLPFASEPTGPMSDPEALPQHKGPDPTDGITTRGSRQRRGQSQKVQVQNEEQDAEVHARPANKRRRR